MKRVEAMLSMLFQYDYFCRKKKIYVQKENTF